MGIAIWWVRRDLRLEDNPALHAAIESAGPGGQVLPVFILDPRLLRSPWVGEKRLAFLIAGLRALAEDLRLRGGRLIIRHGTPEDELAALQQELRARPGENVRMYAEPDYSPFARSRDTRLPEDLPLEWVGSPAVYPPGSVVKPDGRPYTVFTAFAKAWKSLPRNESRGGLPAPAVLSTPDWIPSLPIPEQPALPAGVPFRAGEVEALRRLRDFTQGKGAPVHRYAAERDRLDLDGTSALSPYLRFGMLSARRAVQNAWSVLGNSSDGSAQSSAGTWLNELIWRDFYIHILYFFPQARAGNFRNRQIPWENDEGLFSAWQEGRTGYPVIDAAMRQMLVTGWMHNRARMLAASFLVKDLLIDWRWGERWFMQHLVDGDPAANNGGWQWAAGTGTDAAPYFRIFNPLTQSLKYDPKGSYIRRWLPELREVPDGLIHQPWRMSSAEQAASGCRIGKDYPQPIVEHAWARERVLSVFRKA